jgi:hypothetical protein
VRVGKKDLGVPVERQTLLDIRALGDSRIEGSKTETETAGIVRMPDLHPFGGRMSRHFGRVSASHTLIVWCEA